MTETVMMLDENENPFPGFFLETVPKHLRSARFDSFERKSPDLADAVEVTVAWTNAFLDGSVSLAELGSLFLTGPVGTGKTHLAVAAGFEMAQHMRRIRFLEIAPWIDSQKAAIADRRPLSKPAELVGRCDLVILDDIGVERPSDFTRERIGMLLTALYNAEKACIITSNLSYSELGSQLGERTGSRLVEMTRKVEIPKTVPDFRVERAKGRGAL